MDGPVGFFPEHPSTLRQQLDDHIGRRRLGLDPGLIIHPQRELADIGPLLGDLYRSLDLSTDVIVVSPHDGERIVTTSEPITTPLGTVRNDDMGTSFLTRHDDYVEDASRIGRLPGPFLATVMLQATDWDGTLLPVGLPREGEPDLGPLLELTEDTAVCVTADLTTGPDPPTVRRQDRELIAGLEDGRLPAQLPLPDAAAFRLCLELGRTDSLRRFGHQTLRTGTGFTGTGAFCSGAL